jgi:type IV pilus biogenesis protein PilP
MRIASNFHFPKRGFKKSGAVLFVALGVCCFFAVETRAAKAVEPTTTAPASASIPAAFPVPPVNTMAAPPSLGAPSSEAPSPEIVKTQGESIQKNISAMEEKITENAKNAIKRLDVVSDSTSLADLNHVRQTITRIEAMIDVEKRLSELAKLRNERHSSSVSSALEGAIPASALGMPAQNLPLPPSPLSDEEQKARRESSSSHPEISRIFGTGGKYTAILKFTNGDLKSVKVGDKVANNDTVRTITSSSVEIGGKETSYTLRVKNVDVVYSVGR